MRVTELLLAHAVELEREFDDHDPVDFTRLLAERLATARRPVPAVRDRLARPPAGGPAPAVGVHTTV
ncbi:hypothetical protein AB0E96_40500, partial [Kitasatospora sp. NPDC036755]